MARKVVSNWMGVFLMNEAIRCCEHKSNCQIEPMKITLPTYYWEATHLINCVNKHGAWVIWGRIHISTTVSPPPLPPIKMLWVTVLTYSRNYSNSMQIVSYNRLVSSVKLYLQSILRIVIKNPLVETFPQPWCKVLCFFTL